MHSGASDSVPSALRTVVVGLLGLAAAMGIGRFAFTPLLPLMQASDGLTLAHGSWLASANYLGYLLGALACAARAPTPQRAARWGLIGVALFTLAMGGTQALAWQLLWRFAAGVASALVLVGVSSWALGTLAARGRSAWSGWVFAGVGVGIAFAGVLGWLAGLTQQPPARAWVALGLVAAAVMGWAGLTLRGNRAAQTGPAPAAAARFARDDLRLVLCYGAFGYGYIIPATFLPAFARTLIDDPRAFGLVWPVFGLAAAASTVLISRWLHARPAVQVWAASQLVMAFGVLVYALWPTLATALLSALCVGGTFMVATMAGIQHARAVAGPRAPRLIGAMTAAFALGQLIGPLTIVGGTVLWPSIAAAAVLLASTAALWWGGRALPERLAS